MIHADFQDEFEKAEDKKGDAMMTLMQSLCTGGALYIISLRQCVPVGREGGRRGQGGCPRLWRTFLAPLPHVGQLHGQTDRQRERERKRGRRMEGCQCGSPPGTQMILTLCLLSLCADPL